MRRLPREPDPGRWMARLHDGVALIVCLGLPLASYADGSGRLAYSMFSATRMVRLEVLATDAAGHVHAIAPTELGERAGGSARSFFAGAEHFRRGPVALQPRAHLADIARLACETSRAVSVFVTLQEKDTPTAPVTSFSLRRVCN